MLSACSQPCVRPGPLAARDAPSAASSAAQPLTRIARCAASSHTWAAASLPWSPVFATPGARSSCSTSQPARSSHVCMANPRRVAKVSSQIQRELSNMFITDPVVSAAIAPERRSGSSDLSAVASITEVYVSGDLQVVKVYVSIYSDNRGKLKAMERLKKLEGYVRTQMGQRVVLRLTPEYRFEYDDSIEEAELVQKVIGQADVARFTAELEAESRRPAAPSAGAVQGWSAQPSPAALSAQGMPAVTAGGVDDEEEDGFLTAQEVAPQQGGSSTAQPGPDQGQRAREFDDEEYEGQGKRYVTYRSEDVFKRRGPFDDLFGEEEPRDNRGSGHKQYRRPARAGAAGSKTAYVPKRGS